MRIIALALCVLCAVAHAQSITFKTYSLGDFEVICKDFNGDDKTDIVLASWGFDDWNNSRCPLTLACYVGSAEGFKLVSSQDLVMPLRLDNDHDFPEYKPLLRAIDLDDDGDLDLVFGGELRQDHVGGLFFFDNNGDGKFTLLKGSQ
jgi:hypothetical protein